MNKKGKHNEKRSFLESQKTSKGMKVPKGYFDEFEREMLAKIKSETREEEVKIIPLKKKNRSVRLLTAISVAASILIALYFFNTTTEVNNSPQLVEESVELESYDFDEYLIAESFTTEELNSVSITENYISEDEILNYILDENYSEFIIYENL